MQRYSYKREAILACVQGTKTHPTAEWVFQQLKPEIPDLSLGTVYRNLGQFKEQGKIISVGVVKGLERYDGDTSPHVHFACEVCGKVIDLETVILPDSAFDEVAAETGAELNGCEISFRGVCNNCQSNEQSNK